MLRIKSIIFTINDFEKKNIKICKNLINKLMLLLYYYVNLKFT
jgi:hypothetical protein